MSGFLYLSDQVLEDLGITTGQIIACIEEAIRAEADGTLWTAPKSVVLPGDGRYIMSTLAASDDPDVVAVKTVMVSPGNPARGLAGINGAIILLDSETGLLRAVVGANWVTAVRTAGLSAAVAKQMASPDAASVAFIGSGVQAHSHLQAFGDLFPLTDIRVFGRGQANIDKLCEAARAKGLAARGCATAREAVEGADLVVTSITLSYDVAPFIDARWLKPGAFAAITDLALPWIPEGMAAFGAVIIDNIAQEAASEKKMVDPALIAGDLGGLVTGKHSAGFDPARCSAFVFRGLAIGDIAVSALAYRQASAAGRGTPVAG